MILPTHFTRRGIPGRLPTPVRHPKHRYRYHMEHGQDRRLRGATDAKSYEEAASLALMRWRNIYPHTEPREIRLVQSW